MNSLTPSNTIFVSFLRTSVFRMFGTNSSVIEKLINITSKCDRNGAPTIRAKWLFTLALLVVSLVIPYTGQASQFVGNFFGPPPTEETPSEIEVPPEIRKIGQSASESALLGVMGFFELARLREFGYGVNNNTYQEVLAQVRRHFSATSSLLASIKLEGEGLDLEFATGIPGVENTGDALQSLIGCLGAVGPERLTNVSDLVKLAASASEAIRQVIESRANVVTREPFLALVARELSAYLSLGALIARIGKATYFPNSEADADVLEAAYGRQVFIQCS